MTLGYIAYVLSDSLKDELLKMFPPRHDTIYAHHITALYNVSSDVVVMPISSCSIIKRGVNDTIETLFIKINGVTRRSDGKKFHITWSLNKASGARPSQSNSILLKDIEYLQNEVIIENPSEYFKSTFIPFSSKA